MKESKTYCLKDYKNRHCWQSIGVFARATDGAIMQVLKCLQCEKCYLKELEEIVRVYQ